MTEILSSIEFQMSLLLFVALAGYLIASNINQSAAHVAFGVKVFSLVKNRVMGTRMHADTIIIRENPSDPCHPCSIYAKFRKHTKFMNSLNNCANQIWSIELHLQTFMSQAMAQIEKRLERLEGLENWFVKISHIPTKMME